MCLCVRFEDRASERRDAEAVRACREYRCMATWMRAPACVNVLHDCVRAECICERKNHPLQPTEKC